MARSLLKVGILLILALFFTSWSTAALVPDIGGYTVDTLTGKSPLQGSGPVQGTDLIVIPEPENSQIGTIANLDIRAAVNPNPPSRPVKLIFIHHSTGENWLTDGNGRLGLNLRSNRYFVSDTYYGWGPDFGSGPIGDFTDIGHWNNWFRGSNSKTIISALYNESEQYASYSRLATDPGGENKIIMIKSCFPNSNLQGNVADPIPSIASNPLKGQDSSSEYHTISNAKGIYIDLLNYFKTRQDKLFIVVTAPPVSDGTWSRNARYFNLWLTHDWLKKYPYKNVFVFDFYNVLTSNGGSSSVNDFNKFTGNHHRYWNGTVQHQIKVAKNTAAYPSSADDDHPTQAGNLKATGEFIKLLNIAYHQWAG